MLSRCCAAEAESRDCLCGAYYLCSKCNRPCDMINSNSSEGSRRKESEQRTEYGYQRL
jgi:hypothetical protein